MFCLWSANSCDFCVCTDCCYKKKKDGIRWRHTSLQPRRNVSAHFIRFHMDSSRLSDTCHSFSFTSFMIRRSSSWQIRANDGTQTLGWTVRLLSKDGPSDCWAPRGFILLNSQWNQLLVADLPLLRLLLCSLFVTHVYNDVLHTKKVNLSRGNPPPDRHRGLTKTFYLFFSTYCWILSGRLGFSKRWHLWACLAASLCE